MGLLPAQLQTGQHEFLGNHISTFTLLLVGWLILRIRRITPLSSSIRPTSLDFTQQKAYNHLFVLSHADAFPLHYLQVLQPAEDIVLDPKGRLHPELGSLFDGEGLGLEFLKGSWRV